MVDLLAWILVATGGLWTLQGLGGLFTLGARRWHPLIRYTSHEDHSDYPGLVSYEVEPGRPFFAEDAARLRVELAGLSARLKYGEDDERREVEILTAEARARASVVDLMTQTHVRAAAYNTLVDRVSKGLVLLFAASVLWWLTPHVTKDRASRSAAQPTSEQASLRNLA